MLKDLGLDFGFGEWSELLFNVAAIEREANRFITKNSSVEQVRNLDRQIFEWKRCKGDD